MNRTTDGLTNLSEADSGLDLDNFLLECEQQLREVEGKGRERVKMREEIFGLNRAMDKSKTCCS